MISNSISQDIYNKNSALVAELGIKNLSDFAIRVLRVLLQKQSSCGKIFYSHETIAAIVGCSVSTVRRTLNYLRSQGIVKWQTRFKKTSLYFIHAGLLIKSNLKQIQQFFITYFKVVLPKSLRSSVKSPESCVPENERVREFKGIFNMIISQLSKVVKGVDPEDPFGDKTAKPPVFKKTEKKELNDPDHPVRDIIIARFEKHLPLNEHGRIKLRQYPSYSLLVAERRLKSALSSPAPFLYLLKVCEYHCRENGFYIEKIVYHQKCHEKGIDPKDNNFYDKDAFEQSKMKKIVHPDSARNSEGADYKRSSSYVPWKPDTNRRNDDVPQDLSFLKDCSLLNSTAEYFRDILLGKVKVM